MEEFKADILSVNKKGRFFFYFLITLIILIIAVLIFLQIIPIVLQLFSIIAWTALVARYLLQTKKQVLKKTTGVLKISAENIFIDDEIFRLSSVKAIKLYFSGWKSYKRSDDRNLPISNFHNGDKNLLTIIANDRLVRCEFLINDKEHWQVLREHVLNWYRQKIELVEDSEHGKTYGLQVLNYSEIQQFKKETQPIKTSAP